MPATPTSTATRPATQRPAARVRGATRETSPLGVARTAFTLLSDGPAPMSIDGREYPGLPNRDLPLPELRRRLLAGGCPRSTRDAVWAELVRRSRTRGAAWTVACVGLALPALNRMSRELCSAFAGDKADVQAEILLGFLTGLASIDPDRPSVMTRLRWHAYRAGHAAIRDALDAPTPFRPGFDSAPPPPVAGHPDFVLARAVAAGAISRSDAEVIGTTRLEDVSLRDWARRHQLSYAAARQVRSRAERRLLAWLAEQPPDVGAPEPRPDLLDAAAGSPPPRSPRPLSHIGPRSGVGGRGGSPRTPAPSARPTDRAEEPRCA